MLDKIAQHFKDNFPLYENLFTDDIREYLNNPQVLDNAMAHIAENGHDDPQILNTALNHVNGVQLGTTYIPKPSIPTGNVPLKIPYDQLPQKPSIPTGNVPLKIPYDQLPQKPSIPTHPEPQSNSVIDTKYKTTIGDRPTGKVPLKIPYDQLPQNSFVKKGWDIESLDDKTRQDAYSTMKPLTQSFIDKPKLVPNENSPDYLKLSGDIIPLTQGKNNQAFVDKAIIDKAVESAKKQGINPMDLLSLISRESTFGQHYSKTGTTGIDDNDMRKLISGWTLRGGRVSVTSAGKGIIKESPLEFFRFIADKKIPELTDAFNVDKKTGQFYGNEASVDKYIYNHPELIDEYKKKLNSIPISKESSFDLAAKKIKKKGLASYNPGDKDYSNKIAKEKQLLLQEKGLMEYLKTKHGLKF